MKRMILLIAAAWVALAIAGIHDAMADESKTMYVHVREGTFLNGRMKPNLDSEIMMIMGRGFDVHVLQVKNGWAMIEGGEAGTCWCCRGVSCGLCAPGEDATNVHRDSQRTGASAAGRRMEKPYDTCMTEIPWKCDLCSTGGRTSVTGM